MRELLLIKQRTVVFSLFTATFLATFSAIHESLTVATHGHLGEFLLHQDLGNRVDMLRRENDHLKARLLVEENETGEGAKEPVEQQQQQPVISHDKSPVKESVSSFGVSLRFLWEQLKQQTPINKTMQKTIVNLKPRAPSSADDIVMVTHGSLFKLDTFLLQLEYWNGPASFAVYMNSLGDTKPDALNLLETFLEEHKAKLKNTSIHLFMEYTNTNKDPPAYPHNPLRNLAMDQSDSDYIVALDVDFIPHPKDCYKKMTQTLHARNSSLANEIRARKRIMVMPAFEVYASNGTSVATRDQLPSSKAGLYRSIVANRSESFRLHRYPAGHGPTNFPKWFDPISNPKSRNKKPTNPYFPIFYRPGFEPYVLVYRHGLPKYWNSYRGFGQNKLSWFMELHLAGYKFGTLWEYFVVHLQHPSTLSWKQRRANVRRHEAFLQYLKVQYPLKNNKKVRDERYYFDFKMPPEYWGVPSPATTKGPGNHSAAEPTVEPSNNYLLEPIGTGGGESNKGQQDDPGDDVLGLNDTISDENEHNETTTQPEDTSPPVAVDESKVALS